MDARLNSRRGENMAGGQYAHQSPDDDLGRRRGHGDLDDKLFRPGAVRALPAGPWLHPDEPGKLQRVLSARAEARVEGLR